MLKTLHWYITRDLLRVTALALVALTLLMTVLAIIEPLRKRGLATSQVAMLFGFTLPVMLTLTLPFAALFAATIVYGRFAQDREMLACRASGISTMKLLQPALALGIVVTIISMALSNLVAPEMARMGEQAIVKNIRRIAYHKIKTDSYIRFGKGKSYVIHATQVDEKGDRMLGVVFARYRNKTDEMGNTQLLIDAMVASTARFDTKQDPETGTHYASVVLTDQVGPISNYPGRGYVKNEEVPLDNIEIPDQAEEKAGFYNWPRLIATLNDPTKHGEIRRAMERIYYDIRHYRALSGMYRILKAGQPYNDLGDAEESYSITAPKVTLRSEIVELNGVSQADGTYTPVVVHVKRGMSERIVTANHAEIETLRDEVIRKSTIMIRLTGDVMIPDPEGGILRKSEWQSSGLPLPADADLPQANNYAEMQNLLSAIYANPSKYTDSPKILAEVDALKQSRPKKIRGEIIAEMHARLSYGLSCIILVAMGAALGVQFKSGNMLSAFAVAALLAAGMDILILMGKKVISNPKSNDMVGILAIWGGMAVLLLADIIVYYRLSRR